MAGISEEIYHLDSAAFSRFGQNTYLHTYLHACTRTHIQYLFNHFFSASGLLNAK